MVALLVEFEKAGKLGRSVGVSKFSRLFNYKIVRYGDPTMDKSQPITIRELYPNMTDDELAVAEANLKRYVAAIVRIYDRLTAEGKSWPSPLDLTTYEKDPTIPGERSNSP